MNKPLAFIDVETTGGSPSTDRVTEIGIVRVENGKKVSEFSSLVNPGVHIPFFIQQLTGINQHMVDTAPYFEEIKGQVGEHLDGAIFVAHNARFDYSFVQSEFKRYDDAFKAKVLCTVRLSRTLFPQHRKHNLSTIIERFGIEVKDRHRAFDDAHALWDFYKAARKTVGEEIFLEKLNALLKGPQLPAYLKRKSHGKFPDTPGVYTFFGRSSKTEQGELLYVGKSTSLKKRIYSHFTAGEQSPKDIVLSQFVKDIDVIKTAGDLGAQLLEAHMIKAQKPILNKAMRKTRQHLVALKLQKNGYDTVNLMPEDEIDITENEVLGFYTSKKSYQEAMHRLCDEYQLCPVIMGLEKGPRCFNSQIGKCLGACTKDEGNVSYNLRFIEAFSQSKLQPWPFSGAVMYKEISDGIEEHHILNDWMHIATIRLEKDQEEPVIKRFEKKFDVDIYKILKRFVKHTKRIKKLSDEEYNTLLGESKATTIDELFLSDEASVSL